MRRWLGVLFLVESCNPSDAAPEDMAVVSGFGRACVNPGGVPPSNVQISSPALECPTRICIVSPNHSFCTKECESNADCVAESGAVCASGQSVSCAVATF